MDIIVEGVSRMEGWLFQNGTGERMNIQDVNEGFQEELMEV